MAPQLASREIRARFLQFFQTHGHEIVPSASLVPPGADGSLLFTNAGMVPFKQLFLGAEQRAYSRAASAQRCVRAGGKHNDLDQVGLTRRHHTQFEMLGNFSFGDYFKEEAIYFAWRFLTEELQLPKDRLHVTVLTDDDQARALWRQIAGLKDSDIRACGEDDNFWAMGDSGPCGPCSEIFWDLGDHIADPDERFLELWNLVFMQYYRQDGDASGTLHPLPKRSVDTGMGLERVASVLQQVPSNYHTDLFVPILQQVAQVLDTNRTRRLNHRSFDSVLAEELDPVRNQFGSDPQIQTLRIIADHVRAAYGMLSDGIFPSNVGRGYVLRRIIRRAIRMGQNVGGVEQPFLSQIVLPEWQQWHGFAQMQGILTNEEKAFQDMLANGKKALDKVFAQSTVTCVVAGEDAFRLYDTYGIPLDITQVLAEERGFRVDNDGFEVSMNEHRRKAVESSAFTATSVGETSGAVARQSATGQVNEFIGYDSLEVVGGRVLSAWTGKDDSVWITLDPCPFYAEGGGQVGDRGHLLIHSVDQSPVRVAVKDTKRVVGDAIAVHCVVSKEMKADELVQVVAESSTTVDAFVDKRFRTSCAIHHSATHLLQSALKHVLGDHVTQAGSFVAADRLRFDFAHFGGLSTEELERVETRVNELALQQLTVTTQVLPRELAEQSGAICNFGDKYGDLVRVVSMGESDSREFCGGTHVSSTAAVFPFVILSEGSVAAGTRRLEAVAGVEGAKHLQTKDRALQKLAAQLETPTAKVYERATKMQKQIKQLESLAQALSDALASLPSSPVLETVTVDLHMLAVGSSSGDLAKVLRRRAEYLARKQPGKAHVVVMGSQVACASSGDKVVAGKWLQELVKPLGGRGGGNATFAQGSVPEGVNVDSICGRVRAMEQ